ncbi:lasso peptide biosynthesis PqqD family chaperone [Paenibacillus radicis (ex Xue et al. 2023)]|uniref:Lasso peptide biosynthesis PqqD family chaperone n=1 Tax=Paenibacillus radicis (ex Xue et al. 2023) TaxID=2972489 RepID=A0ABT1YQC2_9BACL|nr:lasso peptide biosynthesis PqqD family chaperone [Paenibacillus radicis (ex Xue et al. 2023)]MCR8635381.1 lasso peptide biosynthesis PqqD family chaperone [Paenibacillus radicis (ex Xue et al. 2023)]
MIKNQGISLDDLIVQGSGNIVSNMGGEKVMLSVQNGKYYNLGEMGGVIWDLMKEPISVTQLVSTLVAEYDVDQATCEGQVISFLETVRRENLIQLGDEVNR